MPFAIELDGIFTPEMTKIATVNGASIPSGVIMRDGSEGGLDGQAVDFQGPYAMAISAEVEAMGIAAGNDGAAAVIGGSAYTVLAVTPGRNGISILRLEE
jgi:hypothetical protein